MLRRDLLSIRRSRGPEARAAISLSNAATSSRSRAHPLIAAFLLLIEWSEQGKDSHLSTTFLVSSINSTRRTRSSEYRRKRRTLFHSSTRVECWVLIRSDDQVVLRLPSEMICIRAEREHLYFIGDKLQQIDHTPSRSKSVWANNRKEKNSYCVPVTLLHRLTSVIWKWTLRWPIAVACDDLLICANLWPMFVHDARLIDQRDKDDFSQQQEK